MSLLVFIILFFILRCSPSNEAIGRLTLSSTHQIAQLFELETKFVESLKSLPLQEPEFHKTLNSIYPDTFLKKLKSIKGEDYASHPINALNLARRTGWQSLQLKPWISNYTYFLNYTNYFPTVDDYYEACSGLSLLIEAYQLNLTEFCKLGKIGEHMSLIPPGWSILTDIGISSINRGWYDTGITMMQHSLQAYSGKKEEYQIYKKELDKSIIMHDKLLQLRGPIGKRHRTFRVPFSKELRKKKKYKKILKTGEDIRYRPTIEDNYESLKYKDSALFHKHCRKKEKVLESHERCYLIHNDNPFYKLLPFKMELLSESPFIVIFRDFMSDVETKHFTDIAGRRLRRSQTGSLTEVEGKEEKGELIRTSKQIWLQESTFNISQFLTEEEIQMITKGTGRPHFPGNYKDHLVILNEIGFRITKRIGRATKLNVEDAWSAEAYQIANYGLGGQYDVHFDARGHFEYPPVDEITRFGYENYGDRLATFMVYLRDVPMGGATVFPKINIYSNAQRGDAVFWINLLSDGTLDTRTLHGGCPVLVGSKWITNKWIASNVQMHLYPCPLKLSSNMDIRPALEHF
ncbi:P4HA [Lepeophtheirus salmonis]|uniref:procollagen-proline 4-dioxygenase n=1 Tax=Lepeophtheirus salmonis TaxID=72036 RepID=A0A0K2V128_LEPSM|nr:P4HA [Lepeophtheirus salmonis]CAF2812673.1 P4HA [Lepeophtheirus salmonis]